MKRRGNYDARKRNDEEGICVRGGGVRGAGVRDAVSA